MAYTRNTHRVDDVDGSAASQTIRFGIDGNRFEIDLSDANATALRERLAPYIAAGRRTRHPQGGEREATGVRRRSSPPRLRAPGGQQAGSRNAPPQSVSEHVGTSSPAANDTSGSADKALVPVSSNRRHIGSRNAQSDYGAQLHKLIADLRALVGRLASAALVAAAERIIELLLKVVDMIAPRGGTALDASAHISLNGNQPRPESSTEEPAG